VRVDELGVVVRVDPLQFEWHSPTDILQCVKHPDLRLVSHGFHIRPAALDVGHVQRETVVAASMAAIVTYQVQFLEPHSVLIPFHSRAGGDMLLEQCPRLGLGTALQLVLLPFRSQQPIDGGRADPFQLRFDLARYAHLFELPHLGHYRLQETLQPLATGIIQHFPEAHQILPHDLIVDPRPCLSLLPCPPFSEHDHFLPSARKSHVDRPPPVAQQERRIMTAVTNPLTELLQNGALSAPARPLVAPGYLFTHLPLVAMLSLILDTSLTRLFA